MPGQAFMREVFSLKAGDVAAAMNQPQTVAYVIRAVDLRRRRACCWPSSKALRRTCTPALVQSEMAETYQAWIKELKGRRG